MRVKIPALATGAKVVIGSLLGILFALCAVGVFVQARDYPKAKALVDHGRLTFGRVVEVHHPAKGGGPTSRYRYTVDGREYGSWCAFAQAGEVGRKVRVVYLPEEPSFSSPDPAALAAGIPYTVGFLAALLAGLFGFGLCVWRAPTIVPRARRRRRRRNVDSLDRSKRRKVVESERDGGKDEVRR